MKKYLFGILLGLLFVLSFKLDSFADSRIHVTTNNGFGGNWTMTYDLGADDDFRYCIRRVDNGSYNGSPMYIYYLASSGSNTVNGELHSAKDGNVTTSYVSFACTSHSNDNINYYSSSSPFNGNNGLIANIPLFTSVEACNHYLATGDTTGAENVDDLPFDTVGGSSSIPTPVVNWALNSDGSLSRTLQFTNAQLPSNPNIRMGLQLIVHWASIDNISMSYANQSASALGTGYQVFYDNALSQDGVDLGYPLPSNASDMRPCPSEINFITDTASINLFSAFLASHPVSERTITYSPSGISSFVDSFRSHLGNIDFAYNVPYVSCRYYYKSADGSDLNYGGWTNTYPKLPAQGAVLSINKSNGQIIVPVNDGTVNQGYDINDNPIFDNGTVIESPELVNFDDLNNSVHNLFGYLGQFPSFLAYLFPFLPSWIPILLASVIGTLIVIGVIRIVLK